VSPADVTAMLARTRAAIDRLPERLEQTAGAAIAEGRVRGTSVRATRSGAGVQMVFSGPRARAAAKAARRRLLARAAELTREVRDAGRS
jgi:hypothetical protein